MEIKYKRLTDTAKPFTYGSEHAACMDMYADQYVHISPHSFAVISTGIALEIPEGYYGLIKGRSGLATKGIVSHIGTIDSDYRGEVKAILFNHSNYPYEVNQGDRICQIEIQQVHKINLKEVDVLSDTIRSNNGFGSTGI